MTTDKHLEEIHKRMKDLSDEYSKTPIEDPRRSELESELSALCQRKDIANFAAAVGAAGPQGQTTNAQMEESAEAVDQPARSLRVQQGSTLLVQQMAAGEFKVLIDALHYQIENFKLQGAPVDYVVSRSATD